MKKFTSKNNVSIYLHPEASHCHRNDLIEEVLNQIVVDGSFIRKTINLGRIIGKDHLVETRPDDEIVFFDRGRGYASRFTLSQEAKDTSLATVIIAQCDASDGPEWNGKHVLITLFEGDPGMPEPYGRNEGNHECIAFWETHALVPTAEERRKMEL